MQEYDAALKLLLQGRATVRLCARTGTTIEKWLNVELPKVQNLRLDLLGETVEGNLVHIEEYCLGVFRLCRRFPSQVLVYVAEAPMRMPAELRGANVWFQYRLIDIRELNGDDLLESEQIGGKLFARSFTGFQI